jgi:ubiquinone/menaquinone biosynthesis C-methylase UbiE
MASKTMGPAKQGAPNTPSLAHIDPTWATGRKKKLMGALIATNLHKAEIDQHQRDVNAFFHDHSRYWRDVYQESSLDAHIYRERQAAVLKLVDKLGTPGRSLALEVGCGAGLTTVELAKRGYAVEAIDTVEAMLDLTRQALVNAGVEDRARTTLNDVHKLNFPSRHFDLVVAMGVLPWFERPEKSVLEMYRVLRPGGHVVLTADNNWCLNQMLDPLCFPGLRPLRWKIGDALKRFNLRGTSGPRLYRHSIKEIDELLYQTGLHKLEGITVGFGPFTLFKQKLVPDSMGIKVHQKLQALADRQAPGIRSTGVEYVVMARKP